MNQLGIVIVAGVVAFSSGQAGTRREEPTKLECKVLEVSSPSTAPMKELAAVRYAIVRHKNPDDRDRLSAWLRTHSGAEVTFTAADSRLHRGVLRRLRMCFGRGLLIFTEPADLIDGETIVIDLNWMDNWRDRLRNSRTPRF